MAAWGNAPGVLQTKINSAEGAIHGDSLGLTSAEIDARLSGLVFENRFPWGVAPG